MYELVKNITSATVSLGGLLPKNNAISTSSVAVAVSAGAISTYNGVVAASASAYGGVVTATNYAAEKAANVSPETRKKIIYGTAIVAGAGAAMVVAPMAIGAIGFTSGGVAPGSVAASMVSTGATMAGGATPAGGLIATLQSVGAVGSVLGSTGATVTAASTGATMGVRAAYSAEQLRRK